MENLMKKVFESRIQREEAEVNVVEVNQPEGRSMKVSGKSLSELPRELRAAFITAVQAEASASFFAKRQAEGYELFNPVHRMRTRVDQGQVQIEAEDAARTGEGFSIRLQGYGYGTALKQPLEPQARVIDNRIELDHGDLLEWYLNGRLGLEQGFTLDQPLIDRTPGKPLTIVIEIEGDLSLDWDQQAETLEVKLNSSGAVFRYGHVLAHDQKAQMLPVNLKLERGGAKVNPHLLLEIDDQEAVYPLTIDPLIQQAEVPPGDPQANNLYGFAAAIYEDTAVIGGYLTDITGATDAGAAYVFVRTGTSWTQQAKLTVADDQTVDPQTGAYFARAVAIYGETIVIGAPLAGLAGYVYVYVRSGSTWSLQQKFRNSDAVLGDHFGQTVAIFGDTIIAGAANEETAPLGETGSAYIFVRSGTTWTQQAKLIPSDIASNDFFAGFAVDIYGDTAIAGTTGKGLYVFVRSGTTWTQQAKLVPGDSITGTAFAWSASIDGETILVGAYTATVSSITEAGSAYVFTRSGTTWTQQAKLTASDPTASDRFGFAVDVQGNTALIGAILADHSGKTDAGAVYVFNRTGINWSQTDKIIASDAANNDQFGYSVALSKTTAVIGAPVHETSGQSGSAYIFLLSPSSSPNSGAPLYPLAWAGEVHQDASLALRTGEKVETVTDLDVNTPVGAMTFTRTFRQNKLGSYQFMGLGWMHNHAMSLVKTTGTPNRLTIQMENGGELRLSETSAGSNQYLADSGSDAKVVWNPGTSQYTLTASDKSTYVFDSAGKLLSRGWVGGESWMYTYTSGKLTSIDDGYGRGLQFVYRSNPGQFDDGQLWRVGDHQASGLSTGSPSGRYVEFTYTTQKNNGTVVTTPKALLNLVRDVMGNTWTHKYYGQLSGQNVTAQLDFLLETVSPQVDTDGNGAVDTPITVEKLTYTTSGSIITNITRELGNNSLSTAYAFQPSGQNVTNETTAGLTNVHRFSNGVYEGTQDLAGNYAAQWLNFQYRPERVIDAKGNPTQMEWTADGKLLKKATNALVNETRFEYVTSGPSTDSLDYILDAQGRKSQFTYGDNNHPQRPTRVQIYDTNGTTILHWQQWTYDNRGRVLLERLYNTAGTTILREVEREYYTTGNGNGLLWKLTQKDLPSGTNNIVTTFFYDPIGRVIKTTQNTTFGKCQTSFTVYDHANNVVASICNYDPGVSPDPTTAAAAVALFDPAFPDQNRVTTSVYDPLGRQVETTVDDGASYALDTLTVYDSMSRVVRTITNYVASTSISDPYVHARQNFTHGANNDQNLIGETVYNERGFARKQIDVLGNVTLMGYDEADHLVRVVRNASQPNYNNSYGAGGDPDLKQYVRDVGLEDSDQDIITTNEYDAAGNLIRSTDAIGNVTLIAYDKLNRPVKVIRNASQPKYDLQVDPTLLSYLPSSTVDQDLIEVTEYDVLGRITRRQEVSGNWTLYGYDGLGRAVKTIRSASQPTYNLKHDPALRHYVASTAPDQDLITEMAYDPAGRIMYTVDELGRKDWTAYDGLWRVTKRINNARGSGTGNGIKDPRSSRYAFNENLSDQDQISLVEYDSNRRIWRTRDPLGNWTLYGYDAVDRPVRVVRNASNYNYDIGSDPSLSRYRAVTTTQPSMENSADQDILTQTVYDAQGRVAATIDASGNETHYAYDTLGRRLRTIANFVTGAYNPAYPDQDLIQTTTYDLAGRVIATTDARGTQARFAYDQAGRQRTIAQAANTALATTDYTCYDKAGRVLRLIRNWVKTANDAPPDARNLDGSWAFAPSTHGANNDQNLITTFTLDKAGRTVAIANPVGDSASMTYDKDGQPEAATDVLSTVTKYRYDRARRRTLTVQSFVANGEDPAFWKWNGSAWTKSDGTTAVGFGSDNDQNLIMQVDYDKAGRRLAMRDPRGNRTTYGYDQLDRRTSLTDPRGSVWSTAYSNQPNGMLRLNLTNPLTDVIQHDLDRLGRVGKVQYLDESPKYTPDVTFSYDKVGNRVGMAEFNGASLVRNTSYAYDKANRLTSVAFDSDGNGAIDETVTYAYEAGGQRTKLMLPDGKTVTYSYDERGRLINLTDWSSQTAQYSYDGASRLMSQTANGMVSSYSYDPAGRLTLLEHLDGATTLGHFAYTVNARGDRTQAYERLAKAGGGEDEHTLGYSYDAVSRLQNATRYPGSATSGTPQRGDSYTYDVASNRLSQAVALNGGSPTTTNYTYDAANRLSSDGTNIYTHDNAGRMTGDGTNTYTWDRADRLLSMGGVSYAYNGSGQRVEQTVGVNTTKYTLDVGLRLWETLVETTGANVTRFVHTRRGLLAQQRPDASWQWALGDGLGSVRGMVNSSLMPQESRLYTPYGEPSQLSGSTQSAYGFTGEPTDDNTLVYLRGRYYNPSIGQFICLDKLETANRYGYVGGNVVNRVDPSGLVIQRMIEVNGGYAVSPPSPPRNTTTPVRPQTTTTPRPVYTGPITPIGIGAAGPTPAPPPAAAPPPPIHTGPIVPVGIGAVGPAPTPQPAPATVNSNIVLNLTAGAMNLAREAARNNPILSVLAKEGIKLVQGAILDVGFEVQLTANGNTTPLGSTGWQAWSANQVNTAFQSVLRNAAMYNRVAQANNFTPPNNNPSWLFRQVNGPVELQLVSDLSNNFLGRTSTGAFSVSNQPPVYYWGQAYKNWQEMGGDLDIVAPTLIELTSGAFKEGNIRNTSLTFTAGFLIDHELNHVMSANWNAPGDMQVGFAYSNIIGGDTALGENIPNIGARSMTLYSDSDPRDLPAIRDEYWADAAANVQTGNFGLDPGQLVRQAQVEDVLWSVMNRIITIQQTGNRSY